MSFNVMGISIIGEQYFKTVYWFFKAKTAVLELKLDFLHI